MDDSKYLAFLSQRISSLFGLYFPENQWNNLMRCLKNAALDLDYETSLKAIFEWLSQRDIKDEEVKVLTKHLTIGETYFFREKVALNLFQKIIIAEIRTKAIQGELRLRIWSAGCSSGEEPYSIAILLKEMLPDIEKWEITILATDLNDAALEKAKSGIYTSWSFRETSEELKNKYFVQKGKEFHINQEIKQMVQFERLNLLTAAYPSTSTNTHQMDVVFCRNVLMYFAPETIRSIAKRFHQILNQEGWLITSQVELNDDYFAPFLRVKYENGIFYQKKEKVTGSKIENVGVSSLSPKAKIGINETLPKPKGG
ncbi:MAG: protein-glutamate O-methyltransferase CheR, partial [Ignavibacteria bacterium]|nr:protein-glutamate O-methyltransferase CheR [Ignavibacteria bacterium]